MNWQIQFYVYDSWLLNSAKYKLKRQTNELFEAVRQMRKLLP